ncbi:hypothetical protein N0V90_012897 [Kalmusia sp. IMI 367209]|nr:hypothetical protein N0V90_012897 [Kalmusia sp. IMI 367209]
MLFKKPLNKALDIWGLACTNNDNFKVMMSDYVREEDDDNAREVTEKKLKILDRYLRKMLIVDARERPDTKELLGDD